MPEIKQEELVTRKELSLLFKPALKHFSSRHRLQRFFIFTLTLHRFSARHFNFS